MTVHPGRPLAAPMHRRPRAGCACLAVLAGVLLGVPAIAADPAALTIYRCTGSDGHISVGNTPCAAGEQEQRQVMQRPQDPPPRAVTTAPSPSIEAEPHPPGIRVVTVRPPQPMYACLTSEGERYLSDQEQATPRWVPLWVNGRGSVPRRGPRAPGTRPGPPPHPVAAVATTGTWVQDRCERLPQEEVCTHLSDRRYEILRTYHAAMPSEREALDAEQATLDARLADDCPGT